MKHCVKFCTPPSRCIGIVLFECVYSSIDWANLWCYVAVKACWDLAAKVWFGNWRQMLIFTRLYFFERPRVIIRATIAKNISCMFFFYKYNVLKDVVVNLDPYIYVSFYSAVSRSLSIQPIILLLSSAYSALLRELKIWILMQIRICNIYRFHCYMQGFLFRKGAVQADYSWQQLSSYPSCYGEPVRSIILYCVIFKNANVKHNTEKYLTTYCTSIYLPSACTFPRIVLIRSFRLFLIEFFSLQ